MIAVAVAVLAGSLGALAMAQERGERGRPDERQRRGRFDREQMRERINERMKEMLGVSDAEWTVIGPRLEKVQSLQRQTRAGGGMFGFMRGRRAVRGRGRQEGERPDRDRRGERPEPERETGAVEKASEELQEALDDDSVPAARVKEKLTAYRAAREKALQELALAQKELREVVTVRQEARLVLMGILD